MSFAPAIPSHVRQAALPAAVLLLGGMYLAPAIFAAADPRPPSSPAPPQVTEFFEREVRPLLLSRCASCHGATVQQSGLRLDTEAGLRKGGQGGAVVSTGQPATSRLLTAVRRRPGVAPMPPTGPLSAAEVAVLERWVQLGAPWGAKTTSVGSGTAAQGTAVRRSHWAFRPVSSPALPRVRTAGWVRNPVDAFVLAKLEQKGLRPSPEADRRTLIRRVTYDLIGLPPTPAEVAAFAADADPQAYSRLVDRLLASPQYGVRWARHWLDVARYADTKDGVLQYGDARIRPYAHTYRDYVVRALNEDTPYPQFIREQLAADQVDLKGERWRLGAMGFLTLGRQFDNNIHDVIDDRIDVTTRGFLGLTAACARCHDHKYDPIPTADYYSLYGTFASSEMPLELPIIGASENPAAGQEFLTKAGAKVQEIRQFLETQYDQERRKARERVADYLVRAATEKPDPLETAIFFLSLSPEDLRPQIVHRWRRLLERRSQPDDPVFGPWSEWMAMPESQLARQATDHTARWEGRPAGVAPGQVNPLVRAALVEARPTSRVELVRAYGALLLKTYQAAQPAPPAARTGAVRQLLELMDGADSPAYFRKDQAWHYMSRGEKDAYGGKVSELDKLAVAAPQAPPRAMVLQDAAELYEPRIFVRGNPSQPGVTVARQFVRIASAPGAGPFRRGSGRLDLADAIADPRNPLTARVLVNRVWMHHYGEPLVANPGDFGLRSGPPTHPELLDWLAAAFTRNPGPQTAPSSPNALGWSLKALHRLLVTSATYRQASADRPDVRAADPENRLLWRAHRRRLELEPMRDGMLAVAGRLDPTLGGRPVDLTLDPGSPRRTLYGIVERQHMPGMYRAFDFANPDQTAERRPRTTTPQQALFGLNSKFVLQQAKALAHRPEVTAAPSLSARVTVLYQFLFGRVATPAETTRALEFVAQVGARPEGASEKMDGWEQYAQVLLMTNEFLFVD